MEPILFADISYANGEMDFDRFARSDAAGAIIRCGYGKNLTYQDDSQWARNIREVERRGTPYGVYLYSYARDRDSARSEAAHMLRLLGGRVPPYGVWYDMEDPTTIGGDLAGCAEEFCKAMEAAGLYAGVYASLYWFRSFLTEPVFDRYDRWVAQYNDRCDYNKPYGIWQFTSSGDGARYGSQLQTIDLNWVYRDYPALTGTKKKEEEIEMDEKKLVQLITKIAIQVVDAMNPVIKDLKDVPASWREDARELLDTEAINGGTPKEVNATDLNLRMETLKAAIIAHRDLAAEIKKQ